MKRKTECRSAQVWFFACIIPLIGAVVVGLLRDFPGTGRSAVVETATSTSTEGQLLADWLENTSSPFFFVYQFGGMTKDSYTGLRFAVWADGLVVGFNPNSKSPYGDSWWISSQLVKELEVKLIAAGILDDELPSDAIPSHGSVQCGIALKGRCAIRVHSEPPTLQSDRKVLARWQAIKEAISWLILEKRDYIGSQEPREACVDRGCNLSDSTRADWRRGFINKCEEEEPDE